MDKELPKGWRQNIADDGHVLFFKLYKTGTLSKSLESLDKIRTIVLSHRDAQYVGFTLSNDFLTVTLNDLGKNELVEEFIVLAEKIDRSLV